MELSLLLVVLIVAFFVWQYIEYTSYVKNKEKETGITFHYVNENYDQGKIISQHKILIEKSETLLTLKQKISRLELLNYPIIISSFINE